MPARGRGGIAARVAEEAREGDVGAVPGNGGLGGLCGMLLERLEEGLARGVLAESLDAFPGIVESVAEWLMAVPGGRP